MYSEPRTMQASLVHGESKRIAGSLSSEALIPLQPKSPAFRASITSANPLSVKI
jgi:hypothetical protein